MELYLSGSKIGINVFIQVGLYEGGFTWSNKGVKEKMGLSVGGLYVRGLIVGEIQYIPEKTMDRLPPMGQPSVCFTKQLLTDNMLFKASFWSNFPNEDSGHMGSKTSLTYISSYKCN